MVAQVGGGVAEIHRWDVEPCGDALVRASPERSPDSP
jgi:hypothetical protein